MDSDDDKKQSTILVSVLISISISILWQASFGRLRLRSAACNVSKYVLLSACCSCASLTPMTINALPDTAVKSVNNFAASATQINALPRPKESQSTQVQAMTVADTPAMPSKMTPVVIVTDAQGKLAPKTSAALLKKRWRKAYQDLNMLANLEQAVTGNPLIDGNQITLLHDGPQTMAAMIAAIKAAQHHIHLETYIFDHDPLGIAFAELLMERQSAGVQVRIIYDSIGTVGTPKAFFEGLRTAGVELLEFHPVNPLNTLSQGNAWSPNQRDHRKLLVVDGNIAFTGGINISNSYATSSLFRSKRAGNKSVGWRDTHIQIVGPAVAAVQWVFLDTWLEEKELSFEQLPDAVYFPILNNAGKQLVRVLASAPDDNQDIYQAYLSALNQAKRSIHITCAYFVPDDAILNALSAAARRGVDVKLVLPGVNDNDLVSQASKSYFEEMLVAGVQLFQLKVAVLHAKTAVVDRQWSTVGSTNIDTRSFLHNREINVMVFSPEFGLEMENAFAEDLKSSSPVSKEAWADRPVLDRLKQWFARRLAYWL
jgi:cardiolipin synthase